MGQQQLLLVILVTIIVGIATVVAINTFGSAADQANVDAVNNDVAALASAAQGYYMRPTMLGGGSRSFVGLTFEGLAFPYTAVNGTFLVAQNENGRYELSGQTADEFTITAHPASSPTYSPGTVDTNADPVVFTGGADAATEDIITATVEPNAFVIN